MSHSYFIRMLIYLNYFVFCSKNNVGLALVYFKMLKLAA